jgi:tetratricopeptide (TPR) repeat protein
VLAANRGLRDLGRHDIEVLTVAPELVGSLPNRRDTLTSLAPAQERTRYYPPSRTRRIAHGIVELLQEVLGSDGPLSLIVENVEEADPTDSEWLEIALRRLPPEQLHVVLTSRGDGVDQALARAMDRYAIRVDGAPAGAALGADVPAGTDLEEMAIRFVATECTSADERLRAAYDALSPPERATIHDARALELEARNEASLRLGAIPFHRERGTDPSGAGAAALLHALEHCMLNGFYPAVIDLARRSAAVLDWETRAEECWLVTAKIGLALAALGRPDEALACYEEACAQTSLPKVHLRAAYGRAMLYTRYYRGDQRNHARAKAWINCAIALSSLSPDPGQRAFNVSFNENALALIEMHLGEPHKALTLLTRNLEHLDQDIAAEDHVLHRSVVQYNRAQLLDRYGDPEDALAAYTELIGADPNQSEYYLQRAAVNRRLGEVTRAMADYAEAIRKSPPYPEPHVQRAELALAVGDLSTALSDLRYVLELDPGATDARITLANVLLESGDLDGALREVDEGLTRDGEHAELHLIRAMIAHRAADHVGAHEEFAIALDKDPTLAAAWSNRAVLWFEQGEVERAIEDLTRALELDDNPDIRANRALAYETAGRPAEAAADRARIVPPAA